VKLNLAKDEVHPTAAGYAAMRPIAEAALRKS
jgi:lysophospholipase L1-like esterase